MTIAQEMHEEFGILGIRCHTDGQEVLTELFDDTCRRNVYSASKSFTSIAVGFAVQEGMLRLDEKLTDVFAGSLPEKVPFQLEAARVRDLLTMGLGQSGSHLMGAERPDLRSDDWMRLALSYPFSDMPGTVFRYSNVGPYLAGRLVEQRSGEDLLDFLMPRLFEPLDIPRPTWETDHQGHTFGAGGLMLNIHEMHKVGVCLLQNGVWNGRQVIPQAWIREASAVQIRDRNIEYGYLFWRGARGSYRADGKYGQLIIVCPELNSVVTVVSECHRDGLVQALENRIFPVLEASRSLV